MIYASRLACRVRLRAVAAVVTGIFLSVLPPIVAEAKELPIFEIEIKDHLFIPSEIVVPAGVKVKLILKNRDQTSEEFESYELNREKVVAAGKQAIIFIGPLRPGKYEFFGDFHPKTAQGFIIAE